MLLLSTDPRYIELQTKEAKLDVNSRRALPLHCERSWASDGPAIAKACCVADAKFLRESSFQVGHALL